MLAALHQEPYHGGSLDPSAHFGSDAYGSISYMDTAANADELPNPTGLFADYVSGNPGSFDVSNAFTPQDLSMGTSETPNSTSDGENDAGQVKTEPTV